jgi:hypothetical protein
LQQIKRRASTADAARKDRYSKSYIRNRVVLALLARGSLPAEHAGAFEPEWTADQLLQIERPLNWATQPHLVEL